MRVVAFAMARVVWTRTIVGLSSSDWAAISAPLAHRVISDPVSSISRTPTHHKPVNKTGDRQRFESRGACGLSRSHRRCG